MNCLMRGRGRRALVAALSMSLTAPPALHAQQEQERAYTYAVPESPTFHFIGVTPENVTRPASTRALAAALLSAIDTAGTVRQGFALDVAPFQLAKERVDLDDYQTSLTTFLKQNFTVSVGSVRAAGDSAATDAGFGARLTLWDRSDLMTHSAFTDGVAEHILERCIDLEPLSLARQCAATEAADLKKEWLDSLWNAPSVHLAGATAWRFGDSQIDDAHWLGLESWGVAALPGCIVSMSGSICGSTQLLLMVGLENRGQAPGQEDFAVFNYGGRALAGSTTFNVFLEIVGQDRIDPPAGVDESTAGWSGGIEFRAGEGLWLSTGFGSRFATETEDDQIVLIAGLRFNAAKGPMFRETP